MHTERETFEQNPDIRTQSHGTVLNEVPFVVGSGTGGLLFVLLLRL
jgi:hypothetical protein